MPRSATLRAALPALLLLALALALALLGPVGAKGGGDEDSGGLVGPEGTFGGVTVRASAHEQAGTPQSVLVFDLHLEAQDDAPREVSFQIMQLPDGFKAVAPQPVHLPHGGATNATVPFAVLTPYATGYVDQAGVATLRVTSTPLDDPSRAESRDVSFVVAARGAYVPAPSPALLAPLLAAVALLSRTRA